MDCPPSIIDLEIALCGGGRPPSLKALRFVSREKVTWTVGVGGSETGHHEEWGSDWDLEDKSDALCNYESEDEQEQLSDCGFEDELDGVDFNFESMFELDNEGVYYAMSSYDKGAPMGLESEPKDLRNIAWPSRLTSDVNNARGGQSFCHKLRSWQLKTISY